MAKRKGSQKSRLELSQNAHVRLRQKWFDRPGKHASVKHEYHHEVFKEQIIQGRVIPLDDRRAIFKSVEKKYF